MNMNKLFAPVGTKTYIMPTTKYILVYSSNKKIMNTLGYLEKGWGGKQIARPELFPFKLERSNFKILRFNKFTLAIIMRIFKKYPEDMIVFIGENYWYSQFPEEIQQLGNYRGTHKDLLKRMEKENDK